MESGIYCFENLIDGKKYIGQAQNITTRKRVHLNLLKTNNHKENKYLLSAWKKYGKQNFKFWVVEKCPIELLNEREIHWIKKLHSHFTEKGYNFSWGGEAPMRGLNHSEKTKKKMSESSPRLSGENHHNFGTHPSEETRKKLSNAKTEEKNNNFGKHLSEETKEKISAAKIGKHLSEETKSKISKNHADASGKNNPMYGKTGKNSPRWGKHLSKETKQKISDAHSGENHHMFGKHLLKKTREKLSITSSGENNGMSKLREKDVLEILNLFYNKNITRKEISKKYNVNYEQIYRITIGKRWKATYKIFMKNKKNISN